MAVLPVAILPVGSPITHRERKKLATRAAIHDAAFDLVDDRGLSRTTVEAISDRAGVAPRTFWAYFASKEDAVLGHHPGLAEGLRLALLARPAGEDPVTALRHVLDEHIAERLVDSSRAVRRHNLIRVEPQLMAAAAASFDEVERALGAAVGQRLGVDPGVDLKPGVIVAAVGGAYRVAQQKWAEGNGARPFSELVDEAFERLATGLQAVARKQKSRSGR